MPGFGGGLDGENWQFLFTAASEFETRSTSRPTVVLVGCSVAVMGIDPLVIADILHRRGVPTDFVRIATHGATATESALLIWNSLAFRPWLVIYAAASRDFPKSGQPDTGVTRTFYDASADVPSVRRQGAEARLDAYLRRYWKLYRYRFFARKQLETWASSAASWLTPGSPSHAAEPAPPPPTIPPEAFTYFSPFRITPRSWAAWDHWRQTRRFEDYVSWLRQPGMTLLDVYKKQSLETFGPEGNPHADAVDWIMSTLPRYGTQGVIIYFPENPLFRTTEAREFFDPALSDAYAALFAKQAATHGAHFTDLRNLLDPIAFYDMIHVNNVGVLALSESIVALVEQEWRQRRPSSGRPER